MQRPPLFICFLPGQQANQTLLSEVRDTASSLMYEAPSNSNANPGLYVLFNVQVSIVCWKTFAGRASVLSECIRLPSLAVR